MLGIERRQLIMDKIQQEKKVYVSELSQLFSVTEETVRRDLEKLEGENFLRRSYGGAVLNEQKAIIDNSYKHLSDKRFNQHFSIDFSLCKLIVLFLIEAISKHISFIKVVVIEIIGKLNLALLVICLSSPYFKL